MQIRTPRWLFTLLLVVGVSYVIVTDQDQNKHTARETETPRYEATQKQLLIHQDIAITNELCRTQCKTDFEHILLQLQRQNSQIDKKQKLQQLRTEHPHMLSV